MVDHFFDQDLVIAFAHDADDGFGSGRPHEKSPLTMNSSLGFRNCGPDLHIVQGLAVFVTHIFQKLWKSVKPVTDFRNGLSLLAHDGQNLKCGDESIACGRVVRQYDMPGLLAADVETLLAHLFEHVAVADLRSH